MKPNSYSTCYQLYSSSSQAATVIALHPLRLTAIHEWIQKTFHFRILGNFLDEKTSASYDAQNPKDDFPWILRIPVLIRLIPDQGANYAKGLSKLAAEIQERLRTAQIPRKKSGGAGGAESKFKCRILDVLPGDEQLFLFPATAT